MASDIARLLRQFLFRSESAGIAIPPMDGPLTPNELLTTASPVISVDEPRDIALVGDILFVASHSTIWRVDLADARMREHVVLDERIGALATDGAMLYAAVVDRGIVAVDVATGEVVTVAPLATLCPTALAVHEDTLVLTEGSAVHGIEDWPLDLMTKGATGAVRVIDLRTGATRRLAEKLRYCGGVVITDTGEVVYSETWAHRLTAVSLDGSGQRTVSGELPAYPCRISRSLDGGYWLSAFAARTHLIEFVLTQDAYREQMVRSIPQRYWIRPYLRPSDSGLDPLQGGQLKKLGITKPWAPARSYGLVVRLDSHFQPLESYHSRAGGHTHGVVQALEHDGALLVASVGADSVVTVPTNDADLLTAVEW